MEINKIYNEDCLIGMKKIALIQCTFCKKEYEGYPVILCDCLECFAMEMHIKEIYYNDKNNIGVCKSCREKEFSDPVWRIRAWLPVELKLEIVKIKLEKEGNLESAKKYQQAIDRVKKYQKKLEEMPEVQALYMQNNPAMFKTEKPDKKCTFCGENKGQVWINDPNENEPKIENCWWVCKTCEKLIEKEGEFSFLSSVDNRLEAEGIKVPEKAKKHLDNLKKEIEDISYEDGQESAIFEIKKDDEGKYKSKRLV